MFAEEGESQKAKLCKVRQKKTSTVRDDFCRYSHH
jgi:hypothetical protein